MEDGASSVHSDEQPPRKAAKVESLQQESSHTIPPSPYIYFVGAPEQSSKQELSLIVATRTTVTAKQMILALNNQGKAYGRGVLEYATVDLAKEALQVRTNSDLKSQYIRPYCTTVVNYW